MKLVVGDLYKYETLKQAIGDRYESSLILSQNIHTFLHTNKIFINK